jgi:hypothetical protein
MASIGSGSSLYASMQNWQAKQKSYTATFLNNAATLADDIGSSTLSLSQNLAMFSTQQALQRVQSEAASKSAVTKSDTSDPFAAANAAKKIAQIINGTDGLTPTKSSTTDAAKTVSQIINGTSGLMTTGSNGDVTKTINQIIAGTDKVTGTNQSADMMSLTKIMFGIDKLPLPPTTDVAT